LELVVVELDVCAIVIGTATMLNPSAAADIVIKAGKADRMAILLG
jgi:hypothetical protein